MTRAAVAWTGLAPIVAALCGCLPAEPDALSLTSDAPVLSNLCRAAGIDCDLRTHACIGHLDADAANAMDTYDMACVSRNGQQLAYTAGTPFEQDDPDRHYPDPRAPERTVDRCNGAHFAQCAIEGADGRPQCGYWQFCSDGVWHGCSVDPASGSPIPDLAIRAFQTNLATDDPELVSCEVAEPTIAGFEEGVTDLDVVNAAWSPGLLPARGEDLWIEVCAIAIGDEYSNPGPAFEVTGYDGRATFSLALQGELTSALSMGGAEPEVGATMATYDRPGGWCLRFQATRLVDLAGDSEPFIDLVAAKGAIDPGREPGPGEVLAACQIEQLFDLLPLPEEAPKHFLIPRCASASGDYKVAVRGHVRTFEANQI